MGYINWSNKEAPLGITKSDIIPAYVGLGQALDTGVTERMYKLNSAQDYLDTVTGSTLDMTNALDRFIYLAFYIYGNKPIVIYNVDSTSTSPADIVAGIDALEQAYQNLNVRPFVMGAEDSDTEATIRTRLASLASGFDGDHKGRGIYGIDNSITTKSAAIADKTTVNEYTSATWGLVKIGSYDYELDMIAILTEVKNSMTRGGFVHRSISKIKIPSAISYNKEVNLDDIMDLENAGIMSVLRIGGDLYIKGIYTSNWAGSGSALLTKDFQSTVDTLSLTENGIRDYVLKYIIDEPLNNSTVELVVGAINRELGASVNAGAYYKAWVELVSITQSELTLYLKTSPVPPTSKVNIENTVESTEIVISF